MQRHSLRIRSYRSFRVDDSLPADAAERLHKIETFQALRAEGCREKTALAAIGWSRSKYYRWLSRYRAVGTGGLKTRSRRPKRVQRARWTTKQEWAVWRMRQAHPYFGKRRLRVMLARDGVQLSESTIGRILAKGLRLGHVRPCLFCRGRVRAKRRRNFESGHAQPWTRPARNAGPGEGVQIDHMSISRDGATLKEFRAACPVGKYMVSRVYSCATAATARRFLHAVREDLPYPLRSVQVDGGSEFRAEFEDTCQRLEIPLAVLPPRSPKLNGVVERANDSARTEFWNLYQGHFTVREAQPLLAEYQHFYNHVRPHCSLDLRTPMQYLQQHGVTEPSQSHMY